MNESILPSESHDVGERRAPRRFLVEPVDRTDREQLIDGPRVGYRLEHREVAEVRVRQRLLEPLELLGNVRLVARQDQHLLADRPEQILADHAVLEREVTEVEELEDLILVLDGVVIALEQILRADALVRLPHVGDKCGAGGASCAGTCVLNSVTPSTLTTSTE